MPTRQGPQQQRGATASASAWYDRLAARTVTLNPTPRILDEQTLYTLQQGRQPKAHVWQLTETRARVRFLHLEVKCDRATAIKLYLAADWNWRSPVPCMPDCEASSRRHGTQTGHPLHGAIRPMRASPYPWLRQSRLWGLTWTPHNPEPRNGWTLTPMHRESSTSSSTRLCSGLLGGSPCLR